MRNVDDRELVLSVKHIIDLENIIDDHKKVIAEYIESKTGIELIEVMNLVPRPHDEVMEEVEVSFDRVDEGLYYSFTDIIDNYQFIKCFLKLPFEHLPEGIDNLWIELVTVTPIN